MSGLYVVSRLSAIRGPFPCVSSSHCQSVPDRRHRHLSHRLFSVMMFRTVVAICGLASVLGLDHCAVYQDIDEPLRSADYHVQDTSYDAFLCDMYLTPGWYRFSNGGTIPTHMIAINHCGTHVPLWINGPNPTKADGIVTRTICGTYSDTQTCGYTMDIQMLNCGNYYVYNLKPTPGCHMAYCAGTGQPCPVGTISPNGFQPGCVDAYPKISSPILSNPIIRPRTFEFGCTVPFDPSRTDVGFEVQWLFDGKPDPKVPVTTLTGTQREAFMDQQYLENNLNKDLSCVVSSFFTKSPLQRSPEIPSNSYWCGIKVSNASLIVGENEKPKTVQLISTIPFVCDRPTQASCNMEIYLDPNNHDLKTTKACTQTFHNSDWNSTASQAVINFEVLAERDFLKDGDKILALHFNPATSVDVPSVFLNYQIPYMTVQTKDKPTSTCTCTGDPHCTTLDRTQTDKSYFNYYKIGDFTMYKSTTRNFEVQARTWVCSTHPVTCACGVSVREGNDVITLDMCNGHYGHTHLDLHVQHPGSLTQGTTIQRDDAGNNWVIYLPSGAWVKVTNVGNTYLNLEIQAPEDDWKGTEGLCGYFDNDKDNDLKDKDGNQTPFQGLPDKFTETWRLPVGQSFFDKDVPIDPALNNNIYYCNCDSKTNVVDCRIDNKAQRPGMTARCAGCRNVNVQTSTTAAGRRKRSVGDIDVIATPRRYYQHDYGLSFTPDPNASFPTASGKTEAQAKKMCTDAFQRNAAIRSCIAKAGISYDEEIKMCVEDIKLTDETIFIHGAVMQGVANCLAKVLREPSFYDNSTHQPPAFLSEDFCINGCSDRGTCVHGVCHCNHGYVGTGCEIDSTSPPSLVGIAGTYRNISWAPSALGICDLSMGGCDVITVVGHNIHDNQNLRCKIVEMKFDGTSFVPTGEVQTVPIEYQSISHVLCRMPTSSATSGVVAYNISITNDGKIFSNDVHASIVNPSCMNCRPDRGGCTIKRGQCLIEGKCYSDGQVSSTESNKVCNTSRSTAFWTVKGTETLPVAPVGGTEFSRFDIWTTSRSGCQCYFNKSRTDCACCDQGGCQCSLQNHQQCVQCGQATNCGTPSTAPNFGVDGYTLALADCACDFDPTSYTCACCQNGGCMCGKRQKNQCANCTRLVEECGAKPWIFGPRTA